LSQTLTGKLFDHDRLGTVLKKQELDGLILTSVEHVLYFTGIKAPYAQSQRKSPTVAVLSWSTDLEPILVVPRSRKDLVDESWISDHVFYGEFYIDGELVKESSERDLYEALDKALRKHGLTGRIGVDEKYLPASIMKTIAAKFGRTTFIDVSSDIEEMRSVKTPEEMNRLSKAAQIAERALVTAMKMVAPGVTELELERAYRKSLADQGAYYVFGMIGAGERGALPNARPTNHRLEDGEVVRFDVGASFEGYFADLARSVVAGQASEKDKAVYRAVVEAEEKTIGLIAPGTKASDLFNVGEQAVRKAGYPTYKRHHVGHGIGLEVHEAPVLSPGNAADMKPGMVLCVEIPYYINKVGGYHVEDEVIVVPGGHKILTSCCKELEYK